jgi:hypothetical protein
VAQGPSAPEPQGKLALSRTPQKICKICIIFVFSSSVVPVFSVVNPGNSNGAVFVAGLAGMGIKSGKCQAIGGSIVHRDEDLSRLHRVCYQRGCADLGRGASSGKENERKLGIDGLR